jgi:hypothetical protein
MNNTFIRWTSVCGLILAGGAARAQQVQDGPNHFGLSLNFGLNIRADFTRTAGAGMVPSTIDLPGGGHTYSDGYVHTDSSGDAGGQTWNWGYQNSSQVSGDSIAFHGVIDSAAPAVHGATEDPQMGFELTYGRDLGKWKRVTWGVEGAFAFTDIHIKDTRTLQSSVSEVTDTYSLGGITPPSAPYAGNSQGPGPLLGDTPSRSTSVENSVTTGSRTLDGNLFGFRLGPYINVPICSRFDVQLGGGLALGIADTTFSFDETTSSDGGVIHEHASTSGTDGLIGGYVSGRFSFAITHRFSVFAGAQWESLGDSTRQVDGRSARLDLSSSVFLNLGAGISF